MINKKGLWFLTLFSLILVLSVYYITMPDEMFVGNNNTTTNTETKKDTVVTNNEIEDLNEIDVLKQEHDTTMMEQISELEKKLSDSTLTAQEKNDAYESIKKINNNKAIEQQLENTIKNNLELDSFVKKENDQILVVVNKKEHNVELANQIMVLVQKEFDNKVDVSVKFKS